MREIKFRCWHDNKMQRVNYIDFAHEKIDLFASDTIKFKEGVLMQYTGLKDKNGKEIYEGDICDMSILGGDHALMKISIQHGCAGFEPLYPDKVHPYDRCWNSFWDEHVLWNARYFTIIGNIYDNPELLEEKI